MTGPPEPAPDAARSLLQLAEDLALELRPGLKRGSLTLDSSLQQDLGIDSLARVELLLRIERFFKASLPDERAQAAETLRDLLKALEEAKPGSVAAGAAAPAPAEATTEPVGAGTLIEVLEWHAGRTPDRVHITLLDEGDRVESITYADLLREGGEIAAGLRARDLEPAQPVALMLQTCRDYFRSFVGILLAGGIPVPLYPPARIQKIEEHVRRQAGILNSTRAPLMITSEEVKRPAGLVRALAPGLREVVTAADLRIPGGRADRLALKPGDTALLQYTSGSTGDPKGVTLSHANLLANLRAMLRTAKIDSRDVFVSWLPLYHDMGLIGAWLGALYTGLRTVLMSPLMFLSHPQRWLNTISRERGTVSAAPNFAYDLCATRLPDAHLEGLDLSSWRLAFNGAEAVHPETLERFATRFAPYGFHRESMTPVYGLAENCLGVTFPPPGRGPVTDRVDRDQLLRHHRAVPAAPDDPHALTFVACGHPIPGHEVRIVDDAGRECGDREHGRLQFRGPSATGGYYRNPEATRRLFDGDWLNSGDHAYSVGGEIYPAGRAKDLIIKGGRNIIPTEIEEAVSAVKGVRRGCVAVFGSPDPKAGTERVIVVAETAVAGDAARADLQKQISEAASVLLEGPPDEVVLASPRTVPKTPSGKTRRSAAREMYQRGDFARAAPGVVRQMLHLALSAVGPELRRFGRILSSNLYGAWAWIVFAFVSPLVVLTVVPLPGLGNRRALLRAWMRFTFRLLGIRLTVTGLNRVPAGPCILAPNHSSYIDALVTAAAFPPRFGFVVKRELTRNPILNPLLLRLGAVFVERFDPEQSLADTASVVTAVKSGDSMIIFPEGTFRRAPGLLPFKMGAFVTACQNAVPLLPVAIRGSRSVLRDKSWMPRRLPISVEIGEPIVPSGSDWAAAVKLREATRAEIQKGCGEPDLVTDGS